MSDVERYVRAMLRPLGRRLRLMVSRAVVTALHDEGAFQIVQVKLLDGEIRDGVEVLGQYGHSGRPPGKMEGVFLSAGGDRDHGLMICVGDRQFRFKGLANGESVLYDDLGQKVHLTRNGMVIDGAGMPLLIENVPTATVKADEKVRFETARMECTGDIVDRCDSADGRSMSHMRNIYDNHDHNETNLVTSHPRQSM